ncbi:hypothetical protein OAE12_01565 [bacterium]|nr:hypothetical protein [bacterium]
MKKNKIQPSEMTFRFATPNFNGARSFYIDLSQVASIVNRRFYRQGINWAVAGFKVLAATEGSGTINIQKIPNTWISSNSWMKAFSAWNKQQMDTIEESGAESAVAAFRDFKIFADANHVDDYRAAGSDLNLVNLMPTDAASFAAGGEWEPSQIVIPNTSADATGSLIEPREYLLHMVGINNNGGFSRGVIEGYADSRAYPQSPDPVAPDIGAGDNWLRDMFNVGNDNSEIARNATDKNDNLPYPQIEYPGGETQLPNLQVHDEAFITATTIGGMTRLKGGNFPCGLIKLDMSRTAVETGNYIIQIDLVPGNHRGYLCEPMTEM